MDLFTYLLKKKGHNSSVNGDLFSYLLASRKRGTYQTYTGTQINVSDSVNSRMKNWILGGNTNQNGTPTPDAPIDIHNVIGENNVIENTGKNLYEPIIDTRYLNGITPKIEVDGSISISGTPTQQWSNICAVTDIYLEAGTYTFSLSKTYNFSCAIRAFKDPIYSSPESNYEEFFIQAGQQKKTLTLTDNIYHLRFYIVGMTVGTEINENLKIQLEVGNQATPFEKYKGKNYKVSLASKNLMFYNTSQFTAEEETWYFLNGKKGAYGSNIGTKTNIKTPVESGKTYTISYNVNIELKSIQIIYSDEVVIETDTGETGKHIITFTATKNADIIIRVRPFDNQNVDISNIQIEKGNTATPYVPYMTPIELCKIGDYQDKIYKSNDKWLLEQNVEKENIKILGGAIESNGFRSNYNLKKEVTSPYGNMLCNYLARAANYDEAVNLNNQNPNKIGYNVAGTILCNIEGATTREDYLDFFTNHDVIVYYPMATPVITEITDDNLINQLEELAKARSFENQTNISQLSEQLPFDLTVDIKTL